MNQMRATIGLGLAFAVVALGLDTTAYACAPATARVTSCATWLDRAQKDLDRRPIGKRRDRTFVLLAKSSCPAIPQSMKIAAAAAVSRSAQGSLPPRELVAAAEQFLGPACRVPKETATGLSMAAACPLAAPELTPTNAALYDMHAGDYVIMNALLKAFIDAGERNKAATLLILNYGLSSSLIGEKAREKQRPAAGRAGRSGRSPTKATQ